jgi:DNA (cytosine-5)-methyltransferase 1
MDAFTKAIDQLCDAETVAICENDPSAVAVWRRLHGKRVKNLGDIRAAEPRGKKADIVTYGFPCTPYSVQGEGMGFDSITAGDLFGHALRFIRYHKPRVAIAENVKRLSTHGNGKTLKSILARLKGAGYANYHAVLNLSDFGVPQHRERLFIVSVRKDIDQGFEFPVGERTELSVMGAIRPADKGERYPLPDVLRQLASANEMKITTSTNGIKTVADAVASGKVSHAFSRHRLYSVDGICPTLDTDRRNTLFAELNGSLTVRERMILMGYDDEDFAKVNGTVSMTAMNRLIGNGIGVPVVREIIKSLIKQRILEP